MRRSWVVAIAAGLLVGCSGYTRKGGSSVTKATAPSSGATSTPTPTPSVTPSASATPSPSPTITIRPLLQTVAMREIRRDGTNMGPFTVSCPTGYVLTGGGIRLKSYVGGSVKPDSSYPHPTQNAWVVHIGGPQTGHKDNVWDAFAVCLSDPEVPNLQRTVVQGVVETNLTVHHICPNNMVLTDAGTELIHWVSGRNNPEAVFPDASGELITRAGNTPNSWRLYRICLERRNYTISTELVTLDEDNRALNVACTGGKVVAGAGGGTELVTYQSGDANLKRAVPGLWSIEYETPTNSVNTWRAYGRCIKK